MRGLTEDPNSCSWSVIYPRDYHRIVSSWSRGRDFVKRKMLEQEAVFKNQVFELHRLYSVQKILTEKLTLKKLSENPGNGSTNRRFLSMRNGVRPVKVGREIIDLQLSAKGYTDTDEIRHGWMVLQLETGHDRSNQTESSQIFSNDTVQPPVYPLSEHDMARISGERSFSDLEARLRNPEVSYGTRVESSPLSSLDKPSSSSVQRFLPVEVNPPFLNCNTHGRRANPGGDFNGLCQGSFSAVKLQEPKQHNKECSTSGLLDLNATIHHQFKDETESSKSTPCSDDVMIDFLSSRKILGLPIFEKPSIVKKEPSFISSPSIYTTGRPVGEDKTVERDLSINMNCDASVSVTDQHGGAEPAALLDKEEEGKRAVRFRHDIDLNLCASEDEDSVMPSALRVKRKATPRIDLEAPAVLDSEDEAEKTNGDTCGLRIGKDGDFMDELQLLKAAAEVIVAISLSDPDEAVCSSTDCPVKNPLAWFAETVACYGDNDSGKQTNTLSEGRHKEGGREECSSGKFDYFEAMTLNLEESKEEDYMPRPLVPENLKFEEMGFTTTIPNRPRRGQPRRGRPKRDFQRDILPGLTSLARHEVTEDLQMFGGLMKATGYPRNPTRNGSNRGRKRLVTNINRAMNCALLKQPSNPQVGKAGPEDRSFTGWGMASRRPRRQRCPASNTPTVILA